MNAVNYNSVAAVLELKSVLGPDEYINVNGVTCWASVSCKVIQRSSFKLEVIDFHFNDEMMQFQIDWDRNKWLALNYKKNHYAVTFIADFMKELKVIAIKKAIQTSEEKWEYVTIRN